MMLLVAASLLLARCEIGSVQYDVFSDPAEPALVQLQVRRSGKMDTWIGADLVQNRVIFEKAWGTPDLDLSGCTPARDIPVAQSRSGEIVDMDACTYWQDRGADMSRPLAELLQTRKVIPFKAHLRCELAMIGAGTNGPCRKITFAEEIIPLDTAHQCSLGD